jgi:hypothetical protein
MTPTDEKISPTLKEIEDVVFWIERTALWRNKYFDLLIKFEEVKLAQVKLIEENEKTV